MYSEKGSFAFSVANVSNLGALQIKKCHKCRNWLFQWLREITKEKFSRPFCLIDALNFL